MRKKEKERLEKRGRTEDNKTTEQNGGVDEFRSIKVESVALDRAAFPTRFESGSFLGQPYFVLSKASRGLVHVLHCTTSHKPRGEPDSLKTSGSLGHLCMLGAILL